MKRTVLLFVILFWTISSFAQFQRVKNLPNYDNKRVHWGFSFGMDKMDFILLKTGDFNFAPNDNLYGIVHRWQFGGHLGPILEINLGRYWKFRTLVTLTFQQRNLVYYFDHGESIVTIPVASTMIQSPFLIKYHGARSNNIRPYIIFGAAPTYDISARKRPETDEPRVFLRTTDLVIEGGTGLDWFLPYFKLSTELKFGRGLFNVLAPDQNTIYTKYIDALYTTYFMFSLHFEG